VERLQRSFYLRDSLSVAAKILGKYLVRRFDDGRVERKIITEVEAYGGVEDKASHARFGLTKRNKVMFEKGGLVYIYFVYGMYWMFNIITGKRGFPQAILVRSVEGVKGPGKVGRWLCLDKSFYGEDLTKSERIWVEDSSLALESRIKTDVRIGVSYAGIWARKKWRFFV
jgi:DNA-3-methyladenine glycosylase